MHALWIPFDDEIFDCVVAVNLVDRVPHPQRVMTEVRRILKTEGIFITTDPYDWDEELTPERDAEGRKLWLEKDDILEMLGKLGFTIEDSFDNLVYIEKWHRRKYDVFINHARKAKKGSSKQE